jgi:hypothetical protein
MSQALASFAKLLTLHGTHSGRTPAVFHYLAATWKTHPLKVVAMVGVGVLAIMGLLRLGRH